jgi:glycosyltransferase involved in cell wall biosynthesis
MRGRVAALVPNVLGASPGQRVRIETWEPYLRAAGWQVDFYPFEDERLHEVLYAAGRAPAKAARLASCYARHLLTALRGPRCDVLFIPREASLVGPALTERLAAARSGAPVVYDLDDPVFVPYRSPLNGWFSLLKFSRKTHALFRMSAHVIAINNLIAGYARQFNPNVTVIPNCVDTDRYRPSDRPHGEGDGTVRLVWMGSHSTMQNLAALAEPLRRLQTKHRAPLRVVGAGGFELAGVETEFRQWSAETEVESLRDCDVGLVPLPDHPWNRWKFFYKVVQYMAVGLPVVARRMGSNAEIIRDGENGFLVETDEEWHARLRALAEDRGLRRRMGEAARRTVVENYSLSSQMPRVVSVFERVAAAARS